MKKKCRKCKHAHHKGQCQVMIMAKYGLFEPFGELCGCFHTPKKNKK